jgi:hypothetical protein
MICDLRFAIDAVATTLTPDDRVACALKARKNTAQGTALGWRSPTNARALKGRNKPAG